MEKEENSSSRIKKENLEKKPKQTEDKLSEQTENKVEDSSKENELSSEDKIKDLEDKLIRAYAEMENQRRRFEKEKDDAFEYGGFAFAREALNLIDNLVRSKVSLENDEKLKNTEALKKTTEHLDVIYKDMISILKKNNIEEIKSIDQKLDPNLHQPMMEVEDENKEPGTIVQEIQKGFIMKDRLLRPSLVAVSKKQTKKDEESEEVKKDDKNQSNTDEN
ncbi:MAG: nucleotide exchange factor GrpE [Candidatus Pelagibacter bacterium]|jgi:molecular chaperone GrpE|nr:nucleotide exchange factor GrpE [Candidatus Pelagibacter bacterium]